MNAERLTLDPYTENSANAPIELAESSMSGDVYGIRLLEHSYPSPELSSTFAPSADTDGDPLVFNRYQNRQITITSRIVEPSEGAATNLCVNPTFEVNTTGWVVNAGSWASATATRVSSPSFYGPSGDYACRLQFTKDATATERVGTFECKGEVGTVTPGAKYSLSVPVSVTDAPAKGVQVAVVWYKAAGTSISTSSGASTLLTGEQRLTVPNLTAPAEASFASVIVEIVSATSGDTIDLLIDSVQLEPGTVVTNYFDGDMPGCSWSGARHASKSTRLSSGVAAGFSGAGDRFHQTLSDIAAKVDKINREGGTLRRIVPNGDEIVFDLLTASVELTDDRRQIRGLTQATLSLTAKPLGRGPEQSLTLHTETTNPALIFTETISKGDVPALARLEITEGQGVDQQTLLWGMQAAHYDPSASAALLFQAEALTPQGGAATAVGPTGASGSGSNTVKQSKILTTSQSMLSTRFTGEGEYLSHVGTYRVFGRFYRTSAGSPINIRFEWAQGDFLATTANESTNWSQFDRVNAWRMIDLGEVTLRKVITGAQRWEGRVLVNTEGATTELYCDYLMFIPVDEGYGEVKATTSQGASAAFSAHDEFEQTTGNLTGGFTTAGITGATNATPIVITSTSHGLSTGNIVLIDSVLGNTAANGIWTVTNLTANTFSLNTSVGNGTYTSGGTIGKVGKTLPVGGSWVGTGDEASLTDFAMNTSEATVRRSGVSDTNKRFVMATTPVLATTTAAVDFRFSVATNGLMGLALRYKDHLNYVGITYASKFFEVFTVVNGTFTNITAGGGLNVPGAQPNFWYTITAFVDNAGVVRAWLKNRGEALGTPMIESSSVDLATGGGIASGHVGIVDAQASATASNRDFDNFVATTTVPDAAIFASQSAQIRYDGAYREDSTGTVWVRESSYKGDNLRIPVYGREQKTLRTIVKLSRGNIDLATDPTIDDLSAQLFYTPRYLHIPNA